MKNKVSISAAETFACVNRRRVPGLQSIMKQKSRARNKYDEPARFGLGLGGSGAKKCDIYWIRHGDLLMILEAPF